MAKAVASAIGRATTSATTAMTAEPTSGPRNPKDGVGLRGAHVTVVMSRIPWRRHAGPACDNRKYTIATIAISTVLAHATSRTRNAQSAGVRARLSGVGTSRSDPEEKVAALRRAAPPRRAR